MVPEMITGQRRPRSSKSVSTAKIAALALRVSKIVSMISRSAPPSTQAVGRLEVRRDQLVVGHVAGAGVVDVGRDRRGPRRRAERAGDVARALRGRLGHLVAHRPRQPGRLEVELVGELLHAVVGQRDRVGVEGVGLDEVGAGLEVLAVDAGDDVRLGEREQVVVADQVARPVREPLAAVARLVRPVPLDRRTHRTVDDEDALVERRGQLRGRIGANVRRIRHRGSSRRAGAVGPGWGLTSSVGSASGDRTAFPHSDTRVSAPGNRRPPRIRACRRSPGA